MPKPRPEQIAVHWYPAASSGFATPNDWKAWADRLIEATDKPPLWLLNMSIAGSEEALLPIIGALWREVYEPTCVGILHHGQQALARGLRLKDIEAGYYLLMLEDGRLSLSATLIAIGNFTDAADGISAGQCEDFYDLCNRLTWGESESVIRYQLYLLLGKWAKVARSQWAELQALQNLG